MAERLFHDLVTLFVVVNPIGVVPLFIAVAGHESAAARRRIAGQAILISTVILFVFIGIGQIVLEALGINLASFRIAGGLVLLIIALCMVLQEAHDPRADSFAIYGNIAVFPLAMPFIAGACLNHSGSADDRQQRLYRLAAGRDGSASGRHARLHLWLPCRR